MCVDYIRSAYTAYMALDAEATVLQKVRWFFCDSSAKFMSGDSVFRSSNYFDLKFNPPGPGEQLTPKAWSNGKKPGRYTGQKRCGQASWWLDGVPLGQIGPQPTTPRGESRCCGPFRGAYSKAYSDAWDRID